MGIREGVEEGLKGDFGGFQGEEIGGFGIVEVTSWNPWRISGILFITSFWLRDDSMVWTLAIHLQGLWDYR